MSFLHALGYSAIWSIAATTAIAIMFFGTVAASAVFESDFWVRFGWPAGLIAAVAGVIAVSALSGLSAMSVVALAIWVSA
ncbi:hypothetical protein [Mycobacterium asiaticum]|uniref:Uncharacterized protein n=1 Tax=Mycobacterium asiaticum TaxID=1790 RepID=A0A1A3NL43_MYCAS|nr:hypothetical protein [Mycobacterium asiaticum]OBK22546.1 hypothetical protein A5635_21770 [Mycobacterium asiaticum]